MRSNCSQVPMAVRLAMRGGRRGRVPGRCPAVAAGFGGVQELGQRASVLSGIAGHGVSTAKDWLARVCLAVRGNSQRRRCGVQCPGLAAHLPQSTRQPTMEGNFAVKGRPDHQPRCTGRAANQRRRAGPLPAPVRHWGEGTGRGVGRERARHGRPRGWVRIVSGRRFPIGVGLDFAGVVATGYDFDRKGYGRSVGSDVAGACSPPVQWVSRHPHDGVTSVIATIRLVGVLVDGLALILPAGTVQDPTAPAQGSPSAAASTPADRGGGLRRSGSGRRA